MIAPPQEAVLAWQRLAPEQKIRATVKVIGGPVYTSARDRPATLWSEAHLTLNVVLLPHVRTGRARCRDRSSSRPSCSLQHWPMCVR